MFRPDRVKLSRMAIAESGNPLAERILVELISRLAVTAREKGAALLRGGALFPISNMSSNTLI